jgi:integrase
MAIIKRGENRYFIRVYLGRHPITKKRLQINETFYGTENEALKHEQLLKLKATTGEISKSSLKRLNQVIDLYLDNTRHFRNEASQGLIRWQFNKYVRSYLGNHKIEKIKRFDIQQLLNFLLDPKKTSDSSVTNETVSYGLGLGIHTVRKVRGNLNAVFNFAIDMQLVSSNPVRRTRIPPLPRSTVNPLTFEEAWALTSVKDRVWYGDAFILDLHTGLRPQELMALIEDDIDFGTGTLRIERACKWLKGSFLGFGPTKTRSSERVIQLDPEHLEFLRAHLEKLKRHTEEQLNHSALKVQRFE